MNAINVVRRIIIVGIRDQTNVVKTERIAYYKNSKNKTQGLKEVGSIIQAAIRAKIKVPLSQKFK